MSCATQMQTVAVVGAEEVGAALSPRLVDVADASIVVVALPGLALTRAFDELARSVKREVTVVQTEACIASDGSCASEMAARALGDRLEAYAVLAGGFTPAALRARRHCAAVLACDDIAALERLGAWIVDDDIHLHATRDVEGVQWAMALSRVFDFARGLARGAELESSTIAWLMAALEDEIVALASRELGLEDSFVRHGAAWQRQIRARAYLQSNSERFGTLLARGFTISDALTALGRPAREVEATTVLRGLTTRGVSRSCPGIEALANLAIGASSTRELWSKLLGERCER